MSTLDQRLYQQPPHNIDVEQALLGALLINNRAAEHIPPNFDARDFFVPLHQQIFEAAIKLIQAGKPASPITLKNAFEGVEAEAGRTGAQYLGTLAANATTIFNVASYAATITDLSKRRRLIVLAEDMLSEAYNSPIDTPCDALIEKAESQLFALGEAGVEARWMSLGEAVSKAIDRVNAAYQRDGHLSGLATGFVDLDNKMGGLQPSDLIIIAGRPSMGKTALATNIAYHVAKEGTPVDFYSLEMSGEQLALRMLAMCSKLSTDKLRRGDVGDEDFRTLIDIGNRHARLPLHIDETSALSIAQLATRARRNKRRHRSGLIVVDYLQLMQASAKRENRVQDVTAITNGLKALAKELNVPVIALSQLSRETEKRADKRPQLADLRESGSIEQDADVVMFVYRDGYYLERTKPDEKDTAAFTEWQAKMQRSEGAAEVIIAKHRHGPTGIVRLAFDAQHTTFGNLAREPMEVRYA
ncbi:MAG TPA: replicative DNA helicase [Xanthobacteraceae bacterium]|nr:replicative DNA helicase [Xanthobacteraceae bacterium]